MALQTTGRIDASDINNELQVGSNSRFSINSSTARALAGINSGTIKFSDFYGTSAVATKIVGLSLSQTIGGVYNRFYNFQEQRGFSSHQGIANAPGHYPWGEHGTLWDRSNNVWAGGYYGASGTSTDLLPLTFTKRTYTAPLTFTDDTADLTIAGLYVSKYIYGNLYNFTLVVSYTDHNQIIMPYQNPTLPITVARPAYNGIGPIVLQTGFTSLKLYTGSSATSATATPFYSFSRADTYNKGYGGYNPDTAEDKNEGYTVGNGGFSINIPYQYYIGFPRYAIDSSGVTSQLTGVLSSSSFARAWVWRMGLDTTVWNAFAPPSSPGGINISFKLE